MTAVQIEITSTDYLDPDFCWYEFYGSEVDHPLGDVEANAEFFDVAFATIFLHAGLDPGETWYHWARAVYDNGTRKSSIAALGPVLIDGIITAQLNDAAVTYAKIQNVSATDRLLGRSSAGAGPIEEIVATAFARSLLDDADAAAARATLGAIGALNPVFTEDITVGGTDANSVVRFYDANVYIGRASSALEMFGSFGVVITSGVGGDINLNPGAGREAYLSGDLIATEPFVAAAIAALIDSSPGALDTLNELAAALGDDPAFATTIATALGYRLRVDAAQSFSAGEKTQGRSNLGVIIGTDVQAYDADLAALAALGTAGMIARTGAGTAAARTITGTASQITVTNGDGVAGDPTLSLPALISLAGKVISSFLTVGVGGTAGAGHSRITLNGNTNVGSSNPGYLFQLQLDGVDEAYITTRGFLIVSADQEFAIQQGGSGGLYLADGGTAFSAISGITSKAGLALIENALEKASRIRGFTGTYKPGLFQKDDTRRRPFLVAEDFLDVFPEPVDVSNPKILGLDYVGTIPLLFATMPEIRDRIVRLEERTHKLFGYLKKLEPG